MDPAQSLTDQQLHWRTHLRRKKKRYENYPETIMKKREEGNHEREVNVEQRQKMERSTDGEEKVIMEQS